jgi:serine/threonine protein kinase
MPEQKIVGGHFQIISALSSGGFGQTFLAEDVQFAHKPKCVVKQLKPQSNDPKIIELADRLFEQEVVALYRLGKHPQIPTLITHFEENGEFYFVQEYIEGNTFEQELRLGKVYNQSKVIEIVSQLLGVLSFVHQQNVIHRDIKPANLIHRISDGKIVLIDFGAVKQVTNQTGIYPNQMPQNTIAIGSDGFMPPEQLAGQPKFSSDVYAVGMFAVQLLTQTHPTQLRQNQRTGEWVWQDKTNVNPRFAEVVNQMIRFDFRQRFGHAVEADNAFKRLNLNGQGQTAEVWKQHETINGNRDNRQTQRAYSTPIPAYQPHQEFTRQRQYQPTNVAPQNYYRPTTVEPQSNYQRQFQLQPDRPPQSLLEQYAGNNPHQPPLPISDENITASSFSFSDLKESVTIKYFLRFVICVVIFLVLMELLSKVKASSAEEGVYAITPETRVVLKEDHLKASSEAAKKAVTK